MTDFAGACELFALTHLDGRNAQKLVSLRPYFSEFAWMKYRLSVLVKLLVSMARTYHLNNLSPSRLKQLTEISDSFSLKDARGIQKEEAKVHHDLKVIEYFLARKLRKNHFGELLPLVNLGLGSEDINSLALALILKESRGVVLWPRLSTLAKALSYLSRFEAETVMVGRTHAEPAGPTTFGKVVANTLLRLCDEAEIFQKQTFAAKCTGEVGTLSSFAAVKGKVNWLKFSDDFIGSLGLVPSHAATQIAPYDSVVRYLQSLFRLNSILLDFAKNMWLYVLLGFLRVKKIEAEVGSAGMPHKVNPIYFEGAEGGLTVANGIIETLCRSLPVNRLDRDFSDSTTRRNIVLPLALSLLSWQSLVTALGRVEVDHEAIKDDVKRHPEIWIELIKTYGTARGVSRMYEFLKSKTRGREITEVYLFEIIESLKLNREEKLKLKGLIGRHGDNPYPRRIVAEAVRRAKRVFKI